MTVVPRVSGWQPIATAIKDGIPVDLWCVHTTLPAMRSPDMEWRRGQWRDSMSGLPLNSGWHATHWMSPPNPPAEPA